MEFGFSEPTGMSLTSLFLGDQQSKSYFFVKEMQQILTFYKLKLENI